MIKGIIFDMDGVISDTQRLHAQVESGLLARFGIDLTPEEITHRYAGVRTQKFFAELLAATGRAYDLDKLMEENWQTMEKLAAESVQEIPGATQLIKRLAQEKMPLAVASASNLNYIKVVLRGLKVIDYFKAVVSSEMVARGKPSPDIFLLAAEKLRIKPEECLVIEDGLSGMEAAKAAKMKCIGLVSAKEKSYPITNLVLSLAEITPQYLQKIS
jgi:beta-phosphoglucomutase family hydrolase